MKTETELAIENLAEAISLMHEKNDAAAAKYTAGEVVSDTLKGEITALSLKVGELTSVKDRLSAIEASVDTPLLGGGVTGSDLKAKQKEAFQAWARGKTLQGAQSAAPGFTDPDGGFYVPPEMLLEVNRVEETIGAMDMEARSINVGAAATEVLMNLGGTTSGWVSSIEARPNTAGRTISSIIVRPEELYANVPIPQSLLDDSAVDIDAELANEFGIEFGLQRNNAFVNGLGSVSHQPRGYLTETIVDNTAHVKNVNIGAIDTGVAGDFEASPDGGDSLIRLRHSLERQYRMGGNAKFYMNDNTAATVRLLKNTDGSYIWRQGLELNMPSSLLGSEVVIDDFMPDIAVDSLSIAYADMRRGYLIVNRRAISILRDPFTNKPNVQFYATTRVGGATVDFSAIKLLRFSA